MTRRVIHEGRVGTWVSEEVELPNGRRLVLETLNHPGAAAVIPFLDADRILLIRQYRHAVGGYIWEIPAGKLEPGEPPEVCAARELVEETGYRAGRIERLGEIVTTPGFTDERIHLFSAHDLVPAEKRHEVGEVIEIHEVPLAEALTMAERGDLIDAKSIAALFHAARGAAIPDMK